MTQEEKREKWRAEYRKYHPLQGPRTFYHPKMQRIVTRDHYATRIFWNQQMLDILKRNYATMLNEELAGLLGVSQRTVIRKAREFGLSKDKRWLDGIWHERRLMAIASTKINGNAGCIRIGQHLSPATEFKSRSVMAL